MANMCKCHISAAHHNAEMMRKFKEALDEQGLFETFIPSEDAGGNQIDPSEIWGTKWDARNGFIDLSIDERSGNGYFETAWSPPILAFEALSKLGFDIHATYYELCAQYAGVWDDKNGDVSIKFDFNDENWRDKIPDSDLLDLLEEEFNNMELD